MRKLKVVTLVLDFTMYPRMTVDSTHVGRIVEAMNQGAKFPPIVICKKTKRVADGFHRVRAALRIDANAELECVEKSYKSDGDFFLDAIKFNADHGRMLTSYDRTHCALACADLGVDDDLLASVLRIDRDSLKQMRVSKSAKSGTLSVPLKRTIKHMAGRALTKGQARANEKLSGMQQVFYVNQIIMLLENDLLDREDAALMERLQRLSEALNGMVVSA